MTPIRMDIDTDIEACCFAGLAVLVAGSANGSGLRLLRVDWMCVSLLLPLQGLNSPLLFILLSIQHAASSTPCRANRNRTREA